MTRSEVSPDVPAIAITGGIGCGKSETARVLRRDGVPVLDADDVAREIVIPGSDPLRNIAERFGSSVLDEHGGLLRQKLADIVFRDPVALADLNRIVHPLVREAMRLWVRQQRAAGRACAGVVPLLFEIGAENEWDGVICITSSVEVTRKRMRERGWSDDEITRRMAAQMNLEEKMRRADLVIQNDESLAGLAAQTRAAWKELLKKESRDGR